MLLNELFLLEKPETLYVKRKLINSDDLINWAESQGFKQLIDPSEFHVTIAFSKEPFEWDNLKFQKNRLLVRNKKNRKVEHLGDKGAIVLKFDCELLQKRWKEFRDAGASWDYPTYQTHMTLSYEDRDLDVLKIEPYTGELLFGREVHNFVDDNWVDKVKTIKLH